MKEKINRLWLTAMMVFASIEVSAYDAQIDGIYYDFNTNARTATVTYREAPSMGMGSNSYMGKVVIPNSVTNRGTTYSVTSIGSSAFFRCIVTSVTIPNSVTSIGADAFRDCSGSIDIPNSVTSIGSDAFDGSTWYYNQPIGLVYAGKVAYKYKGTMPENTEIILKEGTLGIAGSAFSDCSGLTSIDIPNSVLSIGQYAFSGCSGLTSVTIPNSVTFIGNSAFQGCSGLTSVTINSDAIASKSYSSSSNLSKIFGSQITNYTFGEGVKSIGSYACYNCSGLTSVTIGNSVTSIGGYAFDGCSGLKAVHITDLAKWCGISFAGSNANPLYYAHRLYLNGEEIKNLVIPNSVTSIGVLAFSGCSGLTSVTIGNSVTSIGGSAFYQCSGLKAVYITDLAKWCSISFGGGAANPLYYAHHLYLNDEEVTDLVIPNSVTCIGEYAFGYSSLTSVTIPNSVTSIGSSAFYQCSGLTSVTIPNSVVSIGNSAFSGCSGLTSVTIGNSVTSIGNYAFSGCSGLTSVTIPNSVTSIGSWAFDDCTGLTSVTIGNSVTSIGNYVFSGCSGLTSVAINSNAIASKSYSYSLSLSNIFGSQVTNYTFGGGVKSIGTYACYDCSGLISVTIGNSVTSIGDSAFGYCTGLSSVAIPESVTSIGSSAFSGCSELTNVYITDLAKWCGISFGNGSANPLDCAHHLYLNGAEVTDLVIPNSVTKISDYTFSGCSGLTSVTIPSSVTFIGDYAFSDCNGLTEVHITDLAKWCGISFGNGSANPLYCAHHLYLNGEEIKNLVIPNSVTSIGGYAFEYCSGLTSVTIPNFVTSIGNYAFCKCSGLTSVTIPNSVTSIGSSAFVNCSGLTSVTINSDAIASKSYSSSSRLSNIFGSQVTNYTFGEGVKSIGSYACYNCSSLTSVNIGNSVTSIGKYAFGSTGLKSVVIGSGVLNIANNSFSNPTIVIWLTNTPPSGYGNAAGTVNYVSNDLYTSLSNTTVYPYLSSMFEVDGVRYVPVSPSERTCDAIDCLYDSSTEQINIGTTVSFRGIAMKVKNVMPYSCFQNSYITKVQLSFGGDIGKNAFNGCTNLQNATISNQGSIDANAFRSCTALQTATLGAGITEIGDFAFDGCSSLQSMVVPNAVRSLGSYAFQNCSSMTSVKLGTGLTAVNSYAFSGCSSLTDMQIGRNITSIDTYAFQNCYSLSEITIPKAVASIGSYAFSRCKALKNVVMEDQESELTLGSNGSSPLFADCPLDSVYIGRNISYQTSSSYGYSPFYRNTSLRSIHITDKETEISENEFYGCTNLKNVRIGNGVTTIGRWAFSGCSSLDFFACGTNVKSIGQETFSDCTAMTKFYSFASIPPTCDSQALDDINKWNCTLYVPEKYIKAYQAAPQWKEFFFMEGGDGVKSLTIDKEESAIEDYYDLSGRKLAQPKRGIHVVRTADGKTRKVLK